MKKSKKFVRTILVVLFACVLSLTGCGGTNDDSSQVDTAVQYEILEEQNVLDTTLEQGEGTNTIFQTGSLRTRNFWRLLIVILG